MVGEQTNKLVGYLAAVSASWMNRWRSSSSVHRAAGKSSLMDAILAFVPEEERIKYSRDDRPIPLLPE